MVFPELLRNQLELVLNHTVKHRKTDNFPRMTKQIIKSIPVNFVSPAGAKVLIL